MLINIDSSATATHSRAEDGTGTGSGAQYSYQRSPKAPLRSPKYVRRTLASVSEKVVSDLGYTKFVYLSFPADTWLQLDWRCEFFSSLYYGCFHLFISTLITDVCDVDAAQFYFSLLYSTLLCNGWQVDVEDLAEEDTEPLSPLDKQCQEIWNTVQLTAVWRPMVRRERKMERESDGLSA